jgi:acetyl esterase/lipase
MKTKQFILAMMMALPMCMAAQSPQVIDLWPNSAPSENGLSGPEEIVSGDRVRNVSKPTLTVYVAEKPNGQAIIACPGGGYVRLAPNHEGHDMASWINNQGITFAVLQYRMPNGHHEVPLDDAKQAVRILRQHASKWGIKTVGIMGASAGGHLASSLATHYTADTRPDFQILFYPSIIIRPRKDGANPLIGEDKDGKLAQYYTNSLHVNAQTPPAFILMSADDYTVGIDGCLDYFKALVKNKVPAALHIYPTGGHGWGYLEKFPYKREWTEEMEKWLRELNK